jgi:HSP20 family molecular chaperone IbpA
MSEEAVTKREDNQAVTQPQDTEAVFAPNIDISENDGKIELILDMPGTDRDSVEITAENNTLTIEGSCGIEAPDGYELVSREYNTGKYRRDFTLSNDVDIEKIKARSKNGVLQITIPKRELKKPRKIKIQS